MALINCPDCGTEVSDKAVACIKCGCPIESKKEKQDILEKSLCTQCGSADLIINENRIACSKCGFLNNNSSSYIETSPSTIKPIKNNRATVTNGNVGKIIIINNGNIYKCRTNETVSLECDESIDIEIKKGLSKYKFHISPNCDYIAKIKFSGKIELEETNRADSVNIKTSSRSRLLINLLTLSVFVALIVAVIIIIYVQEKQQNEAIDAAFFDGVGYSIDNFSEVIRGGSNVKQESEMPQINYIPETDFAEVCVKIGLDQKYINGWQKIDDWQNGTKYNFVHYSNGSIFEEEIWVVYVNYDNTIHSIMVNGLETIYRREYSESVSKNTDDGTIQLVYGELGEYGIPHNSVSDVILYFVPVGQYNVVNNGKNSDIFIVITASDDTTSRLTLTENNRTGEITIGEGHHIELVVYSNVTLTPIN